MIVWIIIFIGMSSNNPLNLWVESEFQSRSILNRSQSALRKSLESIQKMRTDIFKKRTSFSTGLSINLDFSASSKTNHHSSSINLKKIPCNKSENKFSIKNKISQIQRKLKDAKSKMDPDEDEKDTKTIQQTVQSLEEINSLETKESMIYSDLINKGLRKSRLADFTMTTPRPQNLQPVISNPYLSKSSKYYISELLKMQNERRSLAMEHINQSMQMLLQYRLFKINQDFINQEAKVILPFKEGNLGKKTLILDLDQTLVHCFQKGSTPADINLSMKIDGIDFDIGFNIRPYAISFLKRMKKRWEIVVFTASHQDYADAILDELDPEGTLIDHRLYRQHCRQLATDLFVKDLSKINRDLTDVVLVDNSTYSYCMQLDNGIPILPFYQGKDYELTALENYLQKVYESSDVRVINKQYFKLYRYTSFDSAQALVKELYTNKNQ